MLRINYRKQYLNPILNPPLAAIGKTENSHEEIPDIDLEGQGNEKIISPSNINDIYTRLEILLR